MVESAAAVVIVNRETDIVPLVLAQADVAWLVRSQLAHHFDGPDAVAEIAGEANALAAAHDPLSQNMAVFGFAATGLVTQQVHE